jgi:hypothetical protein
LWLADDGQITRGSVRAKLELTVLTAQGLPLTEFGSLGRCAFSSSDRSRNCNGALPKSSARDWFQIYDIIEFLGGDRSIATSGFASRAQTERVRRTAGYYRHLGRQKKEELPKNPPTLREASVFASDLLRQWIATRLASAL